MRRPALLALLVLLAALLAVVALTVPLTVLPGAHPHVDVARDFTATQQAREQAFHAAIHPPAYAALALSLALAAALGLTPLGARLVARLPGGWAGQAVLGVTGLIALGSLVTLPADAQAERVLRRYGLSTQGWGAWLADRAKGVGIAALTTALVVLVVLALARRAPRTWWAWGSLAAVTLTLAGSFAYPVVVEPAFNSFRSLPAGALRSDLLALAARDGVPVRDVLVADASRRTTSLNAYVSGFGASRRIVLYDTLLASAGPREVELVIAHELGHAKRQDVLHGTVIGALGAGVGVCALFLVLGSPRVLRRAGAAGAGDPRVVPLVLFLAAAATFVVSPLTNLVSRQIEARADVHALDLTHDAPTFIAGERRLSTVNLSTLDPSPLVYLLFFDHPSGPQRIATAREWQRLHP